MKISNGKNDAEVMTLDNNKISILKEIFWKMNEITSSTEEVTDKDNKKKIVLHINVNGKDNISYPKVSGGYNLFVALKADGKVYS